MRLTFVCGSAVAIALATCAVFACSSTTVQKVNATIPDGGMQLDDGAVVDMDGNVVEQPDTSTKPSKVDATNETVTVLGTSRTYVLAVPKTYDAARKYPLIIALHGDGQDGPTFRAFLTFDDVAGDDAIVAYPTGSVDLFTPYDMNPDQQLVEATITDVKSKRSIDDTKVWGFGYSKGGFILNEIACRKPGLLTAMAFHAASAPQAEARGADNYPICPGVIGLPVLATEGDKNTDIGADYGANYWAMVDGCGTTRTPTTPPCYKSDGCPTGKPVEYCLAPGVVHYPIWDQAVNVSWAFYKSL